MQEQSLEDKRRRGIYLLPNAFTTGNLFAGFYAIVQAMNGRYETAAIAIFLAMVFDGMDGRVARLTNTQSTFGEQYDSLADVISLDRKSTRLNSSHVAISYAVFCLKKKKTT